MILRLSRNLNIYTLLLVFYTTVFRLALGWVLASERWHLAWPVATVYGAAIFVTGLLLGATDKKRDSRINLPFHYHLITYIVCNGIALGWVLFGIGHQHETLLSTILTIGIWGAFLLAHYLYSRSTIKGMRRDRIFQ